MTGKEIALCNGIIHSASASTAVIGGGLAQIPLSDRLVITPIQVGMAVALGKVFGITIDQISAKATVSSALAAEIGRTASQVIVGWIPSAGNIINAVTAASLTETIGWIMAKEFEMQRDLL